MAAPNRSGGPRRVSAAEALAQLGGFDAVIDARSESEYDQDHLPGAVNWPTLTDAQRHAVGAEYAQLSPFEARKRGAVAAARNIATHIENHLGATDRGWRPLVYCWRGGQRSGSLALVLEQIGFAVTVLEGGYRAFRREVIEQLEPLPATLRWRTIIGRTGSAKSRLLQALRGHGAQVLDLEALACHKGSVLGPLPGQPQPPQKRFETLLWQALRGFDPARAVFVEGESRTIGRLRIPEALLLALRAAPCVQLELPLAARVDFLLDDYSHFVADVDSFCVRLDALRELRGNAAIDGWQASARGAGGGLRGVVEELLTLHYDPVYTRSMQRNFVHFEQARPLPLPDARPDTLAAAAAALAGTAGMACVAGVAGVTEG